MFAALPFPDISPILFSLNLGDFTFALRWYALAYIVGILLGWQVIKMALRRPGLWPADTAPMDNRQLEDLAGWIVLGVILGGRLGYVLFYRFDYYLAHPLEVVQVWQGGMSFHGGFLGVVAVTYLWARRSGLPVASISDSLALVAPIGLMLGRIANFINAELWGRVTDVPWAVIFPGEAAQDCLLPVCARHPSQLYEAGLEGLILGAVLLGLSFGRGALRRPWFITGLFLAGYGVSRFIVEFFRQPDAQFVAPGNPLGWALQLGEYGLTMGQILSIPMLALGLWLASRARRA